MNVPKNIARPEERPPAFLGHPAGLFTLFFLEAWERFTFYGMRALLILFLTAAASRGGLGMTSERAGAIYGLYMACVYLFSLPGGWVADRLMGQRKAAFLGGCLITAGNLLLSIPAGDGLFFTGLTVISLGVGLLKPNVSVMVGGLYEKDSVARRDSGFSIFYFGIYLGAFTAPLVAGTLGETLGFRWGFFSAGIAMMLGLLQYHLTRGWLGEVGLKGDPAGNQGQKNNGGRRGWLAIAMFLVLIALALAFRTAIPLDARELANLLGGVMVALATLFFGYVLLYGGLDRTSRLRVLVILILCLCAAIFIAGIEQSGSTLNLFARDYTDRSYLGAHFRTGLHPVSWYQAIGPIFILLLSPLFAWIWAASGRQGRNPSTPVKFGLSLLLLGSSFLVMVLAIHFSVRFGLKASPGWLVSVFFLQTVGELCIGPIGLASVTSLSPKRFAGQMMGIWFLAAAIGSLVAGIVGGDISASSVSEMPREFLTMAGIGGAGGVIMLILAKPVRKWMAQS